MFSTDKEAPTVANCPQDIHQISDGPKAVTWAEPTFSDNVKVTKVERSHTSGGTFQLGSTYVSYDAQDAAGNRKSCNFEVELKRKFNKQLIARHMYLIEETSVKKHKL